MTDHRLAELARYLAEVDSNPKGVPLCASDLAKQYRGKGMIEE